MAAPERTSPKPRAYRAPAIALAVFATLAVVALGIVAGRWQYGRYEARADAVRAFAAAAAMPDAELAELVAQGPTWLKGSEWRAVSATGTFDAETLTALRGRSIDGTAALHYLAWLSTEQGPLLVDVGWLPRDATHTVELPAGEVEIAGIMRAQEPDDGRRGDGATRIVAAQVPPPPDAGEPLPGYVMLREPCEPEGCLGTGLQPVPLPQLSLGPHLSYAFQWWLLALLAPFAAVFLVRRDARLEREARGEAAEAESPPPSRRTRPKRLSDEEIEDAL